MDTKYNPILSFFEDLWLFGLSLGLFLGGVFLLTLKIPFWSLFFGIASIQVGLVMSIVAFDALLKRKTAPVTEDYKTISCLVCSKQTFVPKYSQVAICEADQIKIARLFKGALMAVFTVIALGSGVYLVGQNQNIAEEAHQEFTCEPGEWQPVLCQCGYWNSETRRYCGDDQVYTCTSPSRDIWTCSL